MYSCEGEVVYFVFQKAHPPFFEAQIKKLDLRQGSKIAGVVLHRVGIFGFFFCLKQGQRHPFTQIWSGGGGGGVLSGLSFQESHKGVREGKGGWLRCNLDCILRHHFEKCYIIMSSDRECLLCFMYATG